MPWTDLGLGGWQTVILCGRMKIEVFSFKSTDPCGVWTRISIEEEPAAGGGGQLSLGSVVRPGKRMLLILLPDYGIGWSVGTHNPAMLIRIIRHWLDLDKDCRVLRKSEESLWPSTAAVSVTKHSVAQRRRQILITTDDRIKRGQLSQLQHSHAITRV